MKLVDLSGQRYGRLVVAERSANHGVQTMWLCRCECGNECRVPGASLKRSVKPTRSCGCLAQEKRIDRTRTDPACQRPGRDGVVRTGTMAGYLAHRYVGERACEACATGAAREQMATRAQQPTLTLRDNLWSKYRLTLEAYQELLDRQGGQCAICRTSSPRDIRASRFHVDHDHACCPGAKSCGQCIRGLLCRGCNTALGNFADDPVRLARAIDYLDRRGE